MVFKAHSVFVCVSAHARYIKLKYYTACISSIWNCVVIIGCYCIRCDCWSLLFCFSMRPTLQLFTTFRIPSRNFFHIFSPLVALLRSSLGYISDTITIYCHIMSYVTYVICHISERTDISSILLFYCLLVFLTVKLVIVIFATSVFLFPPICL